METDRLNLPDTSVVTIELLGHQLQFSQDPNSKHLGTTVWDASMVFAKYLCAGIDCHGLAGAILGIGPCGVLNFFLEKNSRKGRFSSSKLKGKRVIELGAGCGVAGFAMAMLGCEVITSDQKEVVPLLQRNVNRNTSNVMQANANLDSFGSIKVAELDWGNKDHIRAVGPPFDYVIGTDVVYAEHLLDPLLETICALSGPRTTVVVGYEIRSTSVHDKMLHMWKSNFDVKTVPRTKMDPKYQHESIQLFLMGAKSSGVALGADKGSKPAEKKCEVKEGESGPIDEDDVQKDCAPSVSLPSRDLTDWEVRRCGAMAARLLRDVKIN